MELQKCEKCKRIKMYATCNNCNPPTKVEKESLISELVRSAELIFDYGILEISEADPLMTYYNLVRSLYFDARDRATVKKPDSETYWIWIVELLRDKKTTIDELLKRNVLPPSTPIDNDTV